MSTDHYDELRNQYPATITKEQMYKICHISKRTALYLLESGLVPNKNSGKKTCKYTIALEDVIEYLRQREKHPERFMPTDGWYSRDSSGYKPRIDADLSPEVEKKMRQLFTEMLAPYPDVLCVADIMKITGYCKETIISWCEKEYFHRFLIRRKYLIPKVSLLDFMMSLRFRKIAVKSKRHKAYLLQLEAWIEHDSTTND